MENERTTKEQLVEKLAGLRDGIAELKEALARRRSAGILPDENAVVADQAATGSRISSSADEELKKKNGFIIQIAETSPVGIVRVDKTGRIVFANSRAEKILGLKESSITNRMYNDPGWKITDIDGNPFPGEKLPFVVVQKTGKPVFDIRHAIERLGGTRTLLSINASPLFDEYGDFDGMVAAIDDITSRKKSEDELKESERRHRQLFETIGSCVAIYDPVDNGEDFVFVDINPAGEKYGKLKKEEVVGRKVTEVFPKVKEIGLFDVFQRVARSGETEHLPLKLYQDERVTEWVENTVYRLPNGHIVAVYEDTSEKHMTEQALIDSEEKYRRLFEKMMNAFAFHRIIKDDQGRAIDYEFLEVNDAFLKLTGLKRENLIGRRVTEALPGIESDPANWIERYAKVAATGQEERFENYSEVIGKWFTIYAYSPKTDYFVTIFEDITDRKEAEKRHKELEEQLNHTMRLEAVGRLAGGVAHDFNNLLTAINGFAELALDELEEDHPVRQHLDEISGAGRRASDLTAQLLAFSRKQVISPKIIQPNGILDNSQKILRRVIGEDVELIFKPADDLGHIMADPAQLDQIIMNLAVNARDAMPEGGKLSIETCNVVLRDEPVVLDGVAEMISGNYVMIAVSDSGDGMSEETLNRIFEPFFSTKPKGHGTGLGLATVYGIVRQNNGFIDVISKSGAGSTFKIFLPRHQGQIEQVNPQTKTEAPCGHETILLVEDEQRVRSLVKRFLERQGYKVIDVDNGESALAVFIESAKEIDLLLTDVIMPKMSGRQLREKIQEIKPGQKTLFMSGYSKTAISDEMILNEGVAFIQKPFRNSELALKVREAMDC